MQSLFRGLGKIIKLRGKYAVLVIALILGSCANEKKVEEQRAFLTPEILCGTVQFTDGCSPKLDTLISFGIALIHHMTYEDAKYTFEKVIELDKDCFWGYWGKAMSILHPLWPEIPSDDELKEGFILSQTALNLAKSKKEKLYGSAIAAYYNNGLKKTETERLTAFDNGWRAASKELPDDIEAKLFSVLGMLSTASLEDKTFKTQREAGAIAEGVLKVIPDHPGGFHYAIHAYDFPPLAPQALRVARNYYKIAPEIPHALHMPTHIFTRLGYWQESIDLNLRSSEIAKKMPAGGNISAQYFHAFDYLVYAYLQQSEYAKAKDVAELLDTLSGNFQPSPTTAYALSAIPGRLALEYQNWSEASHLSVNNHANFPWKKFPQFEALIYFAKGIGAGRDGNFEIANQSFKKLEEFQNIFNNKESNKYWYNQIEIQKRIVKAWEMYARNEKENALNFMKDAAELEDATEKSPVTPGQLLPAREMLGDILLEMNRPKEAIKEYEMSLQKNPNRFNSLYGAGKSAELLGDLKKEKFYYSRLIETNKSPDLNRERLNHAKKVVKG